MTRSFVRRSPLQLQLHLQLLSQERSSSSYLPNLQFNFRKRPFIFSDTTYLPSRSLSFYRSLKNSTIYLRRSKEYNNSCVLLDILFPSSPNIQMKKSFFTLNTSEEAQYSRISASKEGNNKNRFPRHINTLSKDVIVVTGDFREERILETKNTTLYKHQNMLPKLPVPVLEETLTKYLRSVEPIANVKEYTHTKEAVDELLSNSLELDGKKQILGEYLQEKLLQRQKEYDTSSWLAHWWNTLGYLDVRDSVVINVSYFFHFAQDTQVKDRYRHRYSLHKNQNSDNKKKLLPEPTIQIIRAANLIWKAMHYRQKVVSGTLPPLIVGKNKDPLTSTAFKYMFDSARIPRKERDIYHLYQDKNNDKTKEFLSFSKSPHIIVIYRGCYFVLNMQNSNDQMMTISQIERFLEGIVSSNVNRELGVGILTSWERDKWADAHKELIATSEINENSLQAIESSAFVICLDEESPVTLTEIGRGLLHGNGYNRWYDKTLQLIVFANGEAGMLNEHTLIDGFMTTGLVQALNSPLSNSELQEDVSFANDEHYNKQKSKEISSSSRKGVIEPLRFDISTKTLSSISRATKDFINLIYDHDLNGFYISIIWCKPH